MLLLAGVLLGSIALSSCSKQANRKSPNIILIVVDDLGYADMSCTGLAPDVSTPNIDLLADKHTNQIFVVGPQTLVDQAMVLLKRFDVSLGLTTQVYRFQYVAADRIDRIVRGFVGSQDVDRLYESTVDEEGNLLVARATSDIHQRIRELSEQMDVPVKASCYCRMQDVA